jgi:hypothetical protein
MSGTICFYIGIGGFALLGAVTFVRWIISGWNRVMNTANDLSSTLKDATEIARAYREDLSFIRQMSQSGATPNFGEDPESIIPRQPAAPATMPSPYYARYPVKPEEPDAPAESVGEVDVTATEEEMLDQERNESAVSFETQERQKAATREADQARIKELADMGINAKPEGQ